MALTVQVFNWCLLDTFNALLRAALLAACLIFFSEFLSSRDVTRQSFVYSSLSPREETVRQIFFPILVVPRA
jgi:hypothetical protein